MYVLHNSKLQLETEIPVKEIMRTNVKTIDYNANVVDAASKMCSRDIAGSCVVLKHNIPVGIVTEQDINCKVVAKGKSPHDVLVNEIMTESLITIPQNENVEHAIKLMAQHRVRRLLVVNAEEKLIGIITVRDILSLGVTINELVRDLANINRITEEEGICSRCGCMSNEFYSIDDQFLCPHCKEDESI